MKTGIYDFETLRLKILREFDSAPFVDVGQWQSQDISDKPEMVTKELRFVNYALNVPESVKLWQETIKPNLSWAEDHFQERVSGVPLNPPPSEKWWPFAQQGNAEHKEGEKFSHTYPERIWPKHAGKFYYRGSEEQIIPNHGIRFNYGDLDDVVGLLITQLHTRQAYLPIWFPEDTGTVHGGRVPCSIGYHFLVRQNRMDCSYTMRSCDFLRHWADDCYMAGRLLQWVVRALQRNGIAVMSGSLIMNISSLHVFKGDEYTMAKLLNDAEAENDDTLYRGF